MTKTVKSAHVRLVFLDFTAKLAPATPPPVKIPPFVQSISLYPLLLIYVPALLDILERIVRQLPAREMFVKTAAIVRLKELPLNALVLLDIQESFGYLDATDYFPSLYI